MREYANRAERDHGTRVPLLDRTLHFVTAGGAPMLAGDVAAPRVRVLTEHEARRLLTRVFLQGRGGMVRLRRMLIARIGVTSVGRLADAEVVEHVARSMAAGHVRVYEAPVERSRFHIPLPTEAPESTKPLAEPEETEDLDAWAVGAPDEAVEALLDSPPEPQLFESTVVADPSDAFEGWADGREPEEFAPSALDAQVAALKTAAARGAPFCEECERARQALAQANAEAAEQEAEEDPAPDLDAPTQAAALTAAAESGVPFCEECERAKQALAQANEEAVEEEVEEDPAPDLDGPTQAAALTAAAESGVPFCAECEREKQAAAASPADA